VEGEGGRLAFPMKIRSWESLPKLGGDPAWVGRGEPRRQAATQLVWPARGGGKGNERYNPGELLKRTMHPRGGISRTVKSSQGKQREGPKTKGDRNGVMKSPNLWKGSDLSQSEGGEKCPPRCSSFGDQ